MSERAIGCHAGENVLLLGIMQGIVQPRHRTGTVAKCRVGSHILHPFAVEPDFAAGAQALQILCSGHGHLLLVRWCFGCLHGSVFLVFARLHSGSPPRGTIPLSSLGCQLSPLQSTVAGLQAREDLSKEFFLNRRSPCPT